MPALPRRLLWLSVLSSVTALLPAGAAWGQVTTLTGGQLQPDARLLRSVLEEVHPGVYRHLDSVEARKRFLALEATWATARPLPVAYRDLTLLAGLRDAHTFANPEHQNQTVRAALFGQANRLPFHFRLLGKQMFVTAAVDTVALPRGTEIVRIDEVSVETILDSLLPAVRTDGLNEANRLSRLELTGLDAYETFDVVYPLFFPVGPAIALSVKATDKAAARAVTVPALTTAARETALRNRRGGVPDTRWRLDFLDARTARLTLPDLTKADDAAFNWKQWLAESFAAIRAKRADALILDVRRCAEGSPEVVTELLRYLAARPIERAPLRRIWRINQLPADMAAFLDTSAPTWKAIKPADFHPLADGGFELLTDRTARTALRPYPTAFAGKHQYALCSPRNSAEGFLLLHELQNAGLATLVGQPTGGNRRGSTGGAFFMLRLPNTGLEVDVPLVSLQPLRAQPDEGLEPDDLVEQTAEDLRAGIDPEMARVKALLRDERAER